MKLQSKSATRYVFKNFFLMLPFCVLPAALLTFFQSVKGPVSLFIELAKTISSGSNIVFDSFYGDLYEYFSFVNVQSDVLWGLNGIWFWLITCVITVFGLCLTFSLVERHIKFGTRRIGSLFTKINESFLYVVPYMLLIFVFYELWTLLLCGGIVLLSVLSNGWTFLVLAISMTIVFYLVFFIFFGLLLLTPPSMYFDGYKFGFAASYSARLTGAHFKDFVVRILFALFITQLLLGLSRLVPQQNWIKPSYENLLLMAVRFFCYLWWLMYLPCLSACKYAEYTETKRADIKLKLFD